MHEQKNLTYLEIINSTAFGLSGSFPSDLSVSYMLNLWFWKARWDVILYQTEHEQHGVLCQPIEGIF